MPKTKHILVIRLSAMGDVAMIVPVLRALMQQHHGLKITVLTRSIYVPFFKGISNVTVFNFDPKGKHKGLLGLYKLAQDLKKHNFDAVADLHNVLRSKILKLLLFGTRFIQLDKGRKEKQALISGQIFKQLKTTHQRYADVFEKLGFKIELSNPTFPSKQKIKSKQLSAFLGENKKVIGIAPFAVHKGKMYPLECMEQVIEVLSKEYAILLFGGGDEEVQILNALENRHQHVANVAGKFSLEEEMQLISNVDVMISMDSGNAHIAAMLGIKVITIWGVTHPYAGFAPFNQPEDYALLSNRKQFPLIPTSVYGNKYPEDYREASRSISPNQIIDKIKSIL
jgi:ADP-heptose:LPS heptosyltransferase